MGPWRELAGFAGIPSLSPSLGFASEVTKAVSPTHINTRTLIYFFSRET